ncbi:hypothetical protein KGQ19_12800 [Catenulispora sp. NL8]|uniref:Uncharacterized protein n=1 Tax=Catenulispora pinistramenti TaxID=2705254 RepID=A0ABS5KP13_9ACTN|nr:hypothetical protein [Catenulispora pinistramenti]MBS2547746.1 hypothetical protein [Catenulispora pinistramenti]
MGIAHPGSPVRPRQFLLQQAARRDHLDTVPEPAERLTLRISTYFDNRPFPAAYRHIPDPESPQTLPARLTTPSRVLANGREEDESLRTSLDSLTTQIRARVQQLADRAITEQPTWIEDNRTAPRTPQQEAEWRGHVAVVAAYREQHRTTSEDPVRPLGPLVAADESDHLVHRQAEISVGRMLALSAEEAESTSRAPARSARSNTPRRQLAPARARGLEYDEPQHTSRRSVEHETHRTAEREIGY